MGFVALSRSSSVYSASFHDPLSLNFPAKAHPLAASLEPHALKQSKPLTWPKIFWPRDEVGLNICLAMSYLGTYVHLQ